MSELSTSPFYLYQDPELDNIMKNIDPVLLTPSADMARVYAHIELDDSPAAQTDIKLLAVLISESSDKMAVLHNGSLWHINTESPCRFGNQEQIVKLEHMLAQLPVSSMLIDTSSGEENTDGRTFTCSELVCLKTPDGFRFGTIKELRPSLDIEHPLTPTQPIKVKPGGEVYKGSLIVHSDYSRIFVHTGNSTSMLHPTGGLVSDLGFEKFYSNLPIGAVMICCKSEGYKVFHKPRNEYWVLTQLEGRCTMPIGALFEYDKRM